MQNPITAAQTVGQRFTARKWLMATLWCLCTVLLTGLQLLNGGVSGGVLQKLPEALRIGAAGTSAIILGNLFLQWIREMTDRRPSPDAGQTRRQLDTGSNPGSNENQRGCPDLATRPDQVGVLK
jgi:hypothetical protein